MSSANPINSNSPITNPPRIVPPDHLIQGKNHYPKALLKNVIDILSSPENLSIIQRKESGYKVIGILKEKDTKQIIELAKLAGVAIPEKKLEVDLLIKKIANAALAYREILLNPQNTSKTEEKDGKGSNKDGHTEAGQQEEQTASSSEQQNSNPKQAPILDVPTKTTSHPENNPNQETKNFDQSSKIAANDLQAKKRKVDILNPQGEGSSKWSFSWVGGSLALLVIGGLTAYYLRPSHTINPSNNSTKKPDPANTVSNKPGSVEKQFQQKPDQEPWFWRQRPLNQSNTEIILGNPQKRIDAYVPGLILTSFPKEHVDEAVKQGDFKVDPVIITPQERSQFEDNLIEQPSTFDSRRLMDLSKYEVTKFWFEEESKTINQSRGITQSGTIPANSKMTSDENQKTKENKETTSAEKDHLDSHDFTITKTTNTNSIAITIGVISAVVLSIFGLSKCKSKTPTSDFIDTKNFGSKDTVSKGSIPNHPTPTEKPKPTFLKEIDYGPFVSFLQEQKSLKPSTILLLSRCYSFFIGGNKSVGIKDVSVEKCEKLIKNEDQINDTKSSYAWIARCLSILDTDELFKFLSNYKAIKIKDLKSILDSLNFVFDQIEKKSDNWQKMSDLQTELQSWYFALKISDSSNNTLEVCEEIQKIYQEKNKDLKIELSRILQHYAKENEQDINQILSQEELSEWFCKLLNSQNEAQQIDLGVELTQLTEKAWTNRRERWIESYKGELVNSYKMTEDIPEYQLFLSFYEFLFNSDHGLKGDFSECDGNRNKYGNAIRSLSKDPSMAFKFLDDLQNLSEKIEFKLEDLQAMIFAINDLINPQNQPNPSVDAQTTLQKLTSIQKEQKKAYLALFKEELEIAYPGKDSEIQNRRELISYWLLQFLDSDLKSHFEMTESTTNKFEKFVLDEKPNDFALIKFVVDEMKVAKNNIMFKFIFDHNCINLLAGNLTPDQNLSLMRSISQSLGSLEHSLESNLDKFIKMLMPGFNIVMFLKEEGFQFEPAEEKVLLDHYKRLVSWYNGLESKLDSGESDVLNFTKKALTTKDFFWGNKNFETVFTKFLNMSGTSISLFLDSLTDSPQPQEILNQVKKICESINPHTVPWQEKLQTMIESSKVVEFETTLKAKFPQSDDESICNHVMTAYKAFLNIDPNHASYFSNKALRIEADSRYLMSLCRECCTNSPILNEGVKFNLLKNILAEKKFDFTLSDLKSFCVYGYRLKVESHNELLELISKRFESQIVKQINGETSIIIKWWKCFSTCLHNAEAFLDELLNIGDNLNLRLVIQMSRSLSANNEEQRKGAKAFFEQLDHDEFFRICGTFSLSVILEWLDIQQDAVLDELKTKLREKIAIETQAQTQNLLLNAS